MNIEWRTDRPPEEDCEYLVTYESGWVGVCHWCDTNVYGRSGGRWHWVEPAYAKVKAWMSLPKPYSDPIDKIAQYIDDHADEFSDELYNGLWDVIRSVE